MKWNKTEKTVNAEGTTITYECDELPGIKIESRKRHIPHAGGRADIWDEEAEGVELCESDICKNCPLNRL